MLMLSSYGNSLITKQFCFCAMKYHKHTHYSQTFRHAAPTKWKYTSYIREDFAQKNKMSVVTKTRYQDARRCKQVESFGIPGTPSSNHPRPANCLVLCWPRPFQLWFEYFQGISPSASLSIEIVHNLYNKLYLLCKRETG